VYGGNDGLAFGVMSAKRIIHKSVKNQQGAGKVFSGLIFWLLLDQAKSNSLSGN